jgi:D-proline reductase (dithiol) PrdB
MLPVDYISLITERYEKLGYSAYDWYRADEPPPWTPMTKPLAESRVGLLSTAGTYAKGQVAYYYKDDASIRLIPKTTAVEDIRFSHLTENYLPDPRRDPNCVFPIEPLRQLEAEGVVGSVADDLLSCMGGIYSQRKVRQRLAPAVAEEFQRLKIDVALLVPL